ncbi:MAG: hypothetical protein ABR606_19490 [Vicinamibacterales bacterium]
MKQTWLVGILASMLVVGTTAAQTPRQGDAQSQGEVPTGESMLGSVNIPRPVTADGKPLAAGQYQIRLTPQEAQPSVPGIKMERWVEFVRGGQVRGREVVSIVPAAEEKDLMPGPDAGKPPRNGAKVELLKGEEYVRVWLNRRGVNYLLHLPVSAKTSM